ncbi:MAG: hypothetical protein O3A00_11560 [Planctomycetota bacterium]|nr:hypothetical protein [Planctomycetota bacterium]
MSVTYALEPMAGSQTTPTSRFMLWIDGVGSFLLCVGERVTVGGPRGSNVEQPAADIAFLANLSRTHATLVRKSDSLILEAHSTASVDGRVVRDFESIVAGSSIVLGNSVRMSVSKPSELSMTARLDVQSVHRLEQSVDGILLFAETCLLGPSTDCHVRCPAWPESVLLVRRSNEFYCRSQADLIVGDEIANGMTEMPIGSVVSGQEIRFRIDAFGESP